MRSVTLTHFVNRSPEGESAPLTQRQLYDGLKIKARDGTAFVPAIESCEVLSETETGLLRSVRFNSTQFNARPGPVKERVEFFPPNYADFTILSPTGEPEARIKNIISTTPDGDLLLTFTFAIGPNGPEEVGPAAEEKAQAVLTTADVAIKQTIAVIRQLAKEGKV